ncbi:hypothetical protein D1614_14375, partial [Maribellus luteus]
KKMEELLQKTNKFGVITCKLFLGRVTLTKAQLHHKFYREQPKWEKSACIRADLSSSRIAFPAE